MRLAPGYVYYGTGSDTMWYFDPGSGERRRTDLETIRAAARLTDALPNLDFAMSMGTAPEAPAHLADQQHFAAMVESTTKPVVFTAQCERAIRDITQMCGIVAGGADEFRQRPFALNYAMATAPLIHSEEAIGCIFVCAEAGIPLVYSAAPMLGGTGPITLAGSLRYFSAHTELLIFSGRRNTRRSAG